MRRELILSALFIFFAGGRNVQALDDSFAVKPPSLQAAFSERQLDSNDSGRLLFTEGLVRGSKVTSPRLTKIGLDLYREQSELSTGSLRIRGGLSRMSHSAKAGVEVIVTW